MALGHLQPIVRREPAAAGEPLVQARGLGVRFTIGRRREDLQSLAYRTLLHRRPREAFWALKDVSFRASAGDILGIVGGNGAGKSTLCRALAGLIRPDAGTLAVGARTSALLSLGTGFNPQLSGRENILLNGLMLGFSRRDVAGLVPEIVAFSGLGRFIDEPLKHYSSGMKARLGFSIGAMVEPEILILDETLSVGDLEFTARATEKLHALIGRAGLVVVVTHGLDFVEKHCTRALWLDRGTARAEGRPDDVVSRYRETVPARTPARTTVDFGRPAGRPGPSEVVAARHVAVKFSLGTAGRGRPFWALEDVSFAVSEGEIVGIVGSNGAGKTTLCKVLTGILKPDRGEVRVAGSVTALLTLGAGFNDQLTGRDNVLLNGLMLGIPKRRLRTLFDAIVDFSGLARFIDEPVKHYSKGMRARLGFSIAVMAEPDVLIIDEALNAGDAAFYERATLRIQELMTRAKAAFVVTHSLGFVEAVCSRAIWLADGRVAFDGAPADTVARYREARVVSPRSPDTP